MGGLASRLTSSGWIVHLLTLSRGELCGDPDLREQEERAGAAAIGAIPRFGILPDAEISLRGAIEVVECAIEQVDPCLLLAPVAADSHQDHTTTSAAVQSACWKRRDILFYEGPSTRQFCPNLVVDISATWEIKERALLCHRSQIGPKNLLRWAQAASAYRAWPRYPGGKCEAFQAEQLDAEILFGFTALNMSERVGEAMRVPR
jgi:LmbE family N-acetylglucosaminyl deacetylase